MVGCGVILEFSCGKEIWPAMRVVGTKDVEVGFNFLIGLFSLTIGLGVICCQESNVILDKSG